MKLFYKKILIAILFFILPFGLTSRVFASQINQFNVDISVNKDGTANVSEKILYDLGAESRHGIFRDIFLLKFNEHNQKFKLKIDQISVTDSKGNFYKYTTSNSWDYIKLKIGDPNILIKGLQFYNISYRVSGNATYFSDHDEFYWNVTGNSWEDGISVSQVNLKMPVSFVKSDAKFSCFTGKYDSTENACTANYSNGVYHFTLNRKLLAGEGFTILAGFPKNIIAVLDPEPIFTQNSIQNNAGNNSMIPPDIMPWVLAIAGIWYILGPFIPVIYWFFYGRDPKAPMGVASAWFSAPKSQKTKLEYTPGVCGTIIDETVEIRDITATIVDLARRGYLKIIEKKHDDFYLERLSGMKVIDGDPGLLPFEQKLINILFVDLDLDDLSADGNTKITINGKMVFEGKSSDVDIKKFGVQIPDMAYGSVRVKDLEIGDKIDSVSNMLYRYCVEEHIFPKNPQTVRASKSFFSILAVFTFNIPLLITLSLFGKAMPRKTIYGAQTNNIIKSLKNFLVTQDKQLEHIAEKQVMFEKLLPYAIAFGVEKIWLKRFKELGLKNPEWYTGFDGDASFHNFTFNRVIASSIRHDVNNQSTFYSPTSFSSSRGFSSGFSSHSSGGHSGGFSGGGGGGGGGGKW